MKATVTLNYNLSGMNLLLEPVILPHIQAMANNNNCNNSIPHTGFTGIFDLREWLKRKFTEQEWSDETDNTFVIDPDEKFCIMDSSQQNPIQQKFTIILLRPENFSSPVASCNGDHDDFEHGQFGGEDENTDIDSHTSRGSNRSSVILEIDHTDIFLNKVYAFVRRFIKNVPWLRENFAMSLRTRYPAIPLEAAFSDVVVEVRKDNPIRRFNHHHNNPVTFNQQIPDETVAKGRMFI